MVYHSLHMFKSNFDFFSFKSMQACARFSVYKKTKFHIISHQYQISVWFPRKLLLISISEPHHITFTPCFAAFVSPILFFNFNNTALPYNSIYYDSSLAGSSSNSNSNSSTLHSTVAQKSIKENNCYCHAYQRSI